MDDYRKLLEDFCASAGIRDVSTVLHFGLLDVAGVPMRIEYLEAADECRTVADLGEFPAGREAELHSLMLECNYENDEPALPVLSVHPETGRGVMALRLPVPELFALGGLMPVIREHVLPAVAWWREVAAGRGDEETAVFQPFAHVT